jgi:hypothetical protein
MEGTIIMVIIWHALLLKLPKKMISLDTLNDLITLKSIRLRLELKQASFAVKEKMNFSLIGINILRHSVACARAKIL